MEYQIANSQECDWPLATLRERISSQTLHSQFAKRPVFLASHDF
ncbi:hypothetical protein [Moorena producens]